MCLAETSFRTAFKQRQLSIIMTSGLGYIATEAVIAMVKPG